MIINKPDKRIIRELAKRKLKAGKSKQEVYEELSEQFNFRNEVAEIVRFIPSNERKKKYEKWNIVYLVFLSLLTLIAFFAFNFGSLWYIFLIALVASKQYKYYNWNIFIGVISLISILSVALYSGMDNGITTSWIIMVAVAIPITLVLIFAGIYLPKFITPNYREEKEKYTNNEGNERLRLVHFFDKD